MLTGRAVQVLQPQQHDLQHLAFHTKIQNCLLAWSGPCLRTHYRWRGLLLPLITITHTRARAHTHTHTHHTSHKR